MRRPSARHARNTSKIDCAPARDLQASRAGVIITPRSALPTAPARRGGAQAVDMGKPACGFVRLHCSTQPVMYHIATMEELKRTAYGDEPMTNCLSSSSFANLLFVNVQIGDVSATALFDTGAGMTVIAQSLLHRLCAAPYPPNNRRHRSSVPIRLYISKPTPCICQ